MGKDFEEYYKNAEQRILKRIIAKAKHNKRVKNRKNLNNKNGS